MDRLQEIYKELHTKYVRSRRLFVALNIVAFILAAMLVVFNLFAIRFNPAHPVNSGKNAGATDGTVIWLFIAMAILSGISAALIAIISFLTLRKDYKKSLDKIESIRDEEKDFKNKEPRYSTKEAENIFLDKITKILNK